jgi:hypothetical protein
LQHDLESLRAQLLIKMASVPNQLVMPNMYKV